MNLQTTENEAVADLLDKVSSLPPPPKLLPQLLGILSDPNAEVSRVVDVIVLDPVLTIRVLRLCNSAYFGCSQRVETLAEAVTRLGFHGIFQIVAVVSGETFLQTAYTSAIDADRLWRHLVYAAFAAQGIASRTGADQNFLFTAGLLHDFGKIPLAEILQGDYARLVTDSGLTGRALCDLESASFGMNHAEVGAELLRRWEFSPQLVTNIQFHHEPAAAGECARLSAGLALADAIAHSFDDPENPDWPANPDLRAAAEFLQLGAGDIERIRERVVTKTKTIEAMCGARA